MLINSEPLTNELVEDKSADQLINLWTNTWDSSGNGYFVREESYVPERTNYYFAQLNQDILTFVSFDQDLQTKEYTIHKATYPIETWEQIDSLATPFWGKPEKILEKIGVMDGGETEMQGIKNNIRHKVYSTNASIQDPEFNEVVQVISLHLFGNTIIKKYAEDNKR